MIGVSCTICMWDAGVCTYTLNEKRDNLFRKNVYTCIFHFITTSHKIERLRRASFYAGHHEYDVQKERKLICLKRTGSYSGGAKYRRHTQEVCGDPSWPLRGNLHKTSLVMSAVRSACEKRLSYLLLCHAIKKMQRPSTCRLEKPSMFLFCPMQLAQQRSFIQ